MPPRNASIQFHLLPSTCQICHCMSNCHGLSIFTVRTYPNVCLSVAAVWACCMVLSSCYDALGMFNVIKVFITNLNINTNLPVCYQFICYYFQPLNNWILSQAEVICCFAFGRMSGVCEVWHCGCNLPEVWYQCNEKACIRIK